MHSQARQDTQMLVHTCAASRTRTHSLPPVDTAMQTLLPRRTPRPPWWACGLGMGELLWRQDAGGGATSCTLQLCVNLERG